MKKGLTIAVRYGKLDSETDQNRWRYNGGQLIAEVWDGNYMLFAYDTEGVPLVMNVDLDKNDEGISRFGCWY